MKIFKFLEIGKNLELPHLEAENRLFEIFSQAFHGSVVIGSRIGILVIDIALNPDGFRHIRTVGICFIRFLLRLFLPVRRLLLSLLSDAFFLPLHQIRHSRENSPKRLPEIGLGSIKIAVAVTAHSSVMDVGAVGVKTGIVKRPCLIHQKAHALMSGFSGTQFISKSKHHERGMVRQHENGLLQFCLVIGKTVLRLKRVFRVPVGKLRLHHHTHLVSRRKRRLRGTVGMETHTVNAVRFVGFQNLRPFRHLHGRITCLGKFPAVCLAAQEKSSSVDGKPPFSVIAEIPHAKGNLFLRKAGKPCRKLVKVPLVLVPPPHIFRQRNVLYFHCAFSRGYAYLRGNRFL